MSDAVEFRVVRPGDYETVRGITVRCFGQVAVDAHLERRYGLLNGTSWEERKWAAVADDLGRNPEGCFAALLDGRVVGYVTTAVNRTSSIGRIINLAVEPTLHGRGLGKHLLRRAFEYFREHGVQYYRIETTTDNEVGQALYPRCGFEEITAQIIYFMSAAEAAEWTYAGEGERQIPT